MLANVITCSRVIIARKLGTVSEFGAKLDICESKA